MANRKNNPSRPAGVRSGCRPQLNRSPSQDLNALIENVPAGCIAQFNVVIAGAERELPELLDRTNVSAINVERRVLHMRVDLDLSAVGSHRITRIDGISPTASVVPIPSIRLIPPIRRIR